MATGATINTKVAYGFTKAGTVLGFPYSWYRPTTGKAALDPTNLQGSITAYLTTDASLKSSNPPSDAKPNWFGAYDTTNTQPGDYFVGALGTFFIASEFLPAPPGLVFCNETMSVASAPAEAGGPSARFGDSPASASVQGIYAQSFPGWLKSAERRSTPEMRLPGDVELPSANILLPQSIVQQIRRSDIIITGDALPTYWTVQSADLTFNCWNIVAVQAGG